MIAFVVPARAAQKKVLFYGPTHEPGGVGEVLVNNNPAEFAPIGQGSAIWTPNDPNPALDWSLKTLADFQAFDAIIIGDPSAGLRDPGAWKWAIVNRDIWSAASTGNILLYGEDPQLHAASRTGAEAMIQNGIRFAAAAPGHGLFVCFSTMNPTLPSPVDPMQPCGAHLLSGLGLFGMVPGSYDRVHKLYSHPVTDCLTEADLSQWTQSSHSGFTTWPAGYVPLALMTDAPSDNQTPPSLLPPGEAGLVHLLAKGSFNRFTLSPATAAHPLNQPHTVTATYLSGTGAGLAGATVQFSLLAGSPNYPMTHTGVTGAAGTVSWTYTGTAFGLDTIVATVAGSFTCPPVAMATVDWTGHGVTIDATDRVAVEPSSPTAPPNTGTFTVTRSGTVSDGLAVVLTFHGTATSGLDYEALGSPTPGGGAPRTTLSFSPSELSKTLTVVPLYDNLPETVETVLAKIEPGDYQIGPSAEAVVYIYSASTTVTLSVIDGNTDETGNNPAKLRLTRFDAVLPNSDIMVHLGFTGTARYALDYLIAGLGDDGSILMPAGATTLDLDLYPIPDSRAEGFPGKNLTVALKPSPDDSYYSGSPSSQTLTILENPANIDHLPPNGWEVLPLDYYSGTPAHGDDYYAVYAMGLNTMPDGLGGWKAQVVGDLYYYWNQLPYYPGPEAFRWDNGAWTFQPGVAPQYGSFWTARAINDAGTIVGWDASYYSSGRACVWRNGAQALLPQPSGTYLNTAVALNQWQPLQTAPGGIVVGTIFANNPSRTQSVAWVPDATGNYVDAPIQLYDVGTGTRSSYPAAINQWGQVVGKSQVASGNQYHAFRSRDFNGVPQPLLVEDDMGTATFMDSHSSEANDINDYGELVGASQCPGGQYHAIYKAPYSGQNRGYADLGVLGTATASVATAINHLGLIVGTSGGQAFVVSNVGSPGSQPLLKLVEKAWVRSGNNWVRADAAGWSFNGARPKLNQANWIAGSGTRYGSFYGFALKPRP